MHEAHRALARCDPPAALIGGLAIAAYAVPRSTVDLLFARRPIAQRLLREARAMPFGVPAISIEGLIGFKLQALANAPERPHDRQDIDDLIRLSGLPSALIQMALTEKELAGQLLRHPGGKISAA